MLGIKRIVMDFYNVKETKGKQTEIYIRHIKITSNFAVKLKLKNK